MLFLWMFLKFNNIEFVIFLGILNSLPQVLYWIHFFAYLGLGIFYLQFSFLPCMQWNGLSVLPCVDLSRGTDIDFCWLSLQESLKHELLQLHASGMMAGAFICNSETEKMFSARLPSPVCFTSYNNLHEQEYCEPVFKPMFPTHWLASLIFRLIKPVCSSLPALSMQSFFLLCNPTYRVIFASSITEVSGYRWGWHD